MIEGLRVLPYWQDHLAKTPNDPRANCNECMRNSDAKDRLNGLPAGTSRRQWGCGYLPRPLDKRLGLWSPPPLIDDWAAEDRDTRTPDPVMYCPGYTTSLPEVTETAHNFRPFKSGYLTEALEEQPTREMVRAICILDAANDRFQAFDLERAREEAKRGPH